MFSGEILSVRWPVLSSRAGVVKNLRQKGRAAVNIDLALTFLVKVLILSSYRLCAFIIRLVVFACACYFIFIISMFMMCKHNYLHGGGNLGWGAVGPL